MSSDREQHLGHWLMGSSSGLATLIAVVLLWTHWPARTGRYWETDGYPHQLGGSGPSPAIRPHGRTDPGELIRADLRAIEQYTRLELADIEEAGFEWADNNYPDDWKKTRGRAERHQDFLEYQRAEHRRRDAARKVIVLRPVGTWPRQRRYLVPIITRFMQHYYQRPVRWEDKIPLSWDGRRINGDGAQQHVQFPVNPILDQLQKELPDDALAVIGITAQDLYPRSDWSFVFGMADLRNRIGVISLARLFPYFWGNFNTKLARRLALLRTLKVLAHETDHALGVNHCRAFACAMQGCTGLMEHDRTPAHLCPLCMAKLAWRLKLDVKQRYGELAMFYMRQGLKEEARWYQEQAERLATPPRKHLDLASSR